MGASGGKIFLGKVEKDDLWIEEVYYFNNKPVERDGRYFWDLNRLLKEIIKGIEKADEKVASLESIGIDTWGLDFGLINKDGIIQDPYSYRDSLLSSTKNDVLSKISKKEIFMNTGINHWKVTNTLWQLHYISIKEPELLRSANKILMIPQLISYKLGGKPCTEETIASTSQMVNPETRSWAKEFLTSFRIPTKKLPTIKKSGTKLGRIKKQYTKNIESDPAILLPISHDTASAATGMPLENGSKVFLSTGTWFGLGIELENPLLNEEAFNIKASNELGAEKTVLFRKNMTGFFLLEECRKKWKERNQIYEYSKILREASRAENVPLIDPDHELFSIGGDITKKIKSFCQKTDQKVPENEGEISRCIFESLALKSVLLLSKMMDTLGVSCNRLHICGGGCKNELFCQMLSSAAQKLVIAGPTEAAAVGNILSQARSYSLVRSIEEGRKLVRNNLPLASYHPDKSGLWKKRLNRMEDLLKT